MKDRMTKPEAAAFLGIKPKTLDDWLCKKKAPPHTKYLGRLYFDRKDLEAFRRMLEERRAC